MTTQEFDNTRFGCGDMVKYKQVKMIIASIDFEERLFGIIHESEIQDYRDNKKEADWVRCENCEFISMDESIKIKTQ